MTPTVRVPINEVIWITENQGGYLAAKCIICHQCGWLHGRYGMKFGSRNSIGNELVHRKSCPMNKYATTERDP
jgi:hypothetical protein